MQDLIVSPIGHLFFDEAVLIYVVLRDEPLQLLSVIFDPIPDFFDTLSIPQTLLFAVRFENRVEVRSFG